MCTLDAYGQEHKKEQVVFFGIEVWYITRIEAGKKYYLQDYTATQRWWTRKEENAGFWASREEAEDIQDNIGQLGQIESKFV